MHTTSNASRRDWRGWVLGGVAFVAVVGTLLVPRIPQDASYHLFADTRTITGIPNFWNVISNAPFALVGIYGLTRASRLASRSLWPGYIIFCVAVIAVCFGSAYYHYAPSTPALVWDRLPMSIAFMAVFTLILGDRVNPALSRALLGPLVIIGAATVFYWSWTERHGVGDLRPYALVQFLPFLLIALMLWLYPGSRQSTAWLWWSFLMYFLAKAAERFDAPVYRAVGISGHTIKHLLSAAAVLFALFALLHLGSTQTRRTTLDLSGASHSSNTRRKLHD
jgi:Ceramidase